MSSIVSVIYKYCMQDKAVISNHNFLNDRFSSISDINPLINNGN